MALKTSINPDLMEPGRMAGSLHELLHHDRHLLFFYATPWSSMRVCKVAAPQPQRMVPETTADRRSTDNPMALCKPGLEGVWKTSKNHSERCSFFTKIILKGTEGKAAAGRCHGGPMWASLA